MLFERKIETKIHINFPMLTVVIVSRKYVICKMTCVIKENTNGITISDIDCIKNNKGYGSIMMEKLLEYARDKRYEYVDGWLSKVDFEHKDRLYHFYKKFGFEVVPNSKGNKFADIFLKL